MMEYENKRSKLKDGFQERIVWRYFVGKSIYNSAQEHNVAVIEPVTVIARLLCFTSLHVVSLVNIEYSLIKKCEMLSFNSARLPTVAQISTQQEKPVFYNRNN